MNRCVNGDKDHDAGQRERKAGSRRCGGGQRVALIHGDLGGGLQAAINYLLAIFDHFLVGQKIPERRTDDFGQGCLDSFFNSAGQFAN